MEDEFYQHFYQKKKEEKIQGNKPQVSSAVVCQTSSQYIMPDELKGKVDVRSPPCSDVRD